MSEPAPTPAGIDTNVLVYALSDAADDPRNRMARRLLERCRREERPVMISAISLAEYLVPFVEEQRADAEAAITTGFQVVPFDLKCGGLAAGLWTSGREQRTASGVGERGRLKADTLIVASLKQAGAGEFFTRDP